MLASPTCVYSAFIRTLGLCSSAALPLYTDDRIPSRTKEGIHKCYTFITGDPGHHVHRAHGAGLPEDCFGASPYTVSHPLLLTLKFQLTEISHHTRSR